MKFKKMHGAGNDFILFSKRDLAHDDLSDLARRVCHRHFGIGADGMMVAEPSETEDVRMAFYNADGSIAEMCGNGIRCFSRYVYEEGLVDKTEFRVETLAGPQTVSLKLSDGRVCGVSVDMGKPMLEASAVPVNTDKERFTDENIEINGVLLKVTSIRVGVPHTMVFNNDFTDGTVTSLGPAIESHSCFPQKTNVNFVEVLSESELRVATWERGAGATLACGTGACASFYAAYEKGLVGPSVKVKVPGGELEISLSDQGTIVMMGNAVLIAEGIFNVDESEERR